jgi:small subunit ribosomal protein S20
MKTQIKKALAAIETNDKDNSGDLLKSAISSINKAASKKVIHKNNAARKVSRLSKKANKIIQAKS